MTWFKLGRNLEKHGVMGYGIWDSEMCDGRWSMVDAGEGQ